MRLAMPCRHYPIYGMSIHLAARRRRRASTRHFAHDVRTCQIRGEYPALPTAHSSLSLPLCIHRAANDDIPLRECPCQDGGAACVAEERDRDTGDRERGGERRGGGRQRRKEGYLNAAVVLLPSARGDD